MGNDLGVFEADVNAERISAEAAANAGHELNKALDRAIFRAKERFGAYLANSQSKVEFNERWAEVKAKGLLNVIAEVTTPTPGVLRKVEAALRPSLPVQQSTKKVRPPSAKTARADEVRRREEAYAHRGEIEAGSAVAIEPKNFTRVGATQKHAWSYDNTTKLYTSKDPMQKFACPGCGAEQPQLGFSHCAGCERTWNSWPVRQAGSEKTAATYLIMAREIKMRGDQFKLASTPWVTGAEGAALANDVEKAVAADLSKIADAPLPQEPPPGVQQPNFGTMPGDNSGAMGGPVPPEQPATPGGDADHDGDLAGGVTENSPLDQIQDALQDAVFALKDVQMLSINPALTSMGSDASKKVETLREAMNRFWGLHKQMNYVAGMLAKEANEAVRAADPRIVSEAQFVEGFNAASRNEALPPKTARAWLEGYVAFHAQADTYDTGADVGRITVPTGTDETAAGNEGSTFPNTESTNEIRDDAGPFDTSQPAEKLFVSQMDADNAQGDQDRGQGQSGSIQPTSARRPVPKGRK